MNQRDFIIKLAKEGHDEKEIEEQLKIMFGQQAYKHTAIYKWMALTSLGKEDAPKEKPGPKPDEQLILRISQILLEYPFASIREIAEDLKESPSIIYRYLTSELGRVFKFSRWLPHSLSEPQKFERMVQSSLLLNVLESCKKQSWRNIITGDQSWFKMQYGHKGAWLLPEDDSPEMDGSQISIEKVMVTIIWGVNGFYIVDLLPQKTRYTSQYFINNILTQLNEKKIEIWSEARKRKLWLHLDNCRVHNSFDSSQKYDEYGFKRTPHPPYSPDIAPSDFYLFGYVKDRLKGKKFSSPEDLKDAIIEILNSISRDKRKDVFTEWIKRCTWVTNNGGSYYHKLK